MRRGRRDRDQQRDDLPLPAAYHGVTAPQTIDIEDRSSASPAGPPRTATWWWASRWNRGRARTSVILGLLVIAPILLLAVFLGSLAVGRRVAMPIERARQRQLAFTADASHELRTPLSVIEANASLALAAERDGAWYRRAFERVLRRVRRMRRLIEELLWLARFDAIRPPREPVDLGLLVEQAADRFAARRGPLAVARGPHEAPGVTVSAPPEWIDHLMGVLLDNACRYAPDGGSMLVGVTTAEARRLTVDDSGRHPGGRARASSTASIALRQPGGAGLGLAIADAIVRATSGAGASAPPLGGARMSVSWPVTGGGQGGS